MFNQLWKWQKGRQGSGYNKLLLLFSKKLKFDCWLLHYPPNAYIPEHTDSVFGHEHHRLNIILWKPKSGGELYITYPDGKGRPISSRIHYMRSDLVKHSVSSCNGHRLVLSIGWLKKLK